MIAARVDKIVVVPSTLTTFPVAEAGIENVWLETVAGGPPGVIVLAPTVSAEVGFPEIVTEDIVQTLEARLPADAEIVAGTDSVGEPPGFKEPAEGEDDAGGVSIFLEVDRPALEDSGDPVADEAAKIDDETEGIPLFPEDEGLRLDDGGNPLLDEAKGLVLTLELPGDLVEDDDRGMDEDLFIDVLEGLPVLFVTTPGRLLLVNGVATLTGAVSAGGSFVATPST